jgi:hypothetical protein
VSAGWSILGQILLAVGVGGVPCQTSQSGTSGSFGHWLFPKMTVLGPSLHLFGDSGYAIQNGLEVLAASDVEAGHGF